MSAIELTYNGPAPVNSAGVLDCFVQQPVANSPAEGPNGATYTEKWKGPYSKGKDIFDDIAVGDFLSKFHSWLGSNKISKFEVPYAPYRYFSNGYWLTKKGLWRITNIHVEELTAGDHCIITIDCEVSEEISESSDPLTADDLADTWSVSWQSYSVSPWEFCSGTEHSAVELSPSNQGWQPDWSLPASRSHIEYYKSHNPEVVDIVNSEEKAYAYTPDPKTPIVRFTLSPCECEVLKKVNAQRNATYHYPIVIHQTSYTGNNGINFDKDLGEDLDVECGLPSECPYKFADVKGVGENGEEGPWTWLKIGDDISQTKTKTAVRYTRREVWAGYTAVDKNYYGNVEFDHSSATGVKNGRWYKNCL